MKSLVAVLCPLVLFPASFLLTGCGAAFDSSGAPSQVSVGTIQGTVHGGQQAVVGAKVYLFSTGVTSYGGKGIAASSIGPSSNASISLLNSSGSNTTSDGTNYYVLTGAGGAFTITGDYNCTTGTQLYLYAIGGNAGSGTNANAGFLAGLGSCPVSTSSYIVMNEVTTVATAYALAGFATDATHISTSGSTLAGTGIANAMANIANMVNLSTGAAYTSTHATGSSGAVPQNLVNTLADILAACVNSAGSPSTGCTTLFNNAKASGSTGTAATDTATAAINIAHNPASNVAALYGNPTPSTPFTPPLSAQPNDFTLAITYTGNGVTRTNDPSSYPGTLAIDGSGNTWVLNFTANSVSAFNPLGVPLTGSPFTGNGLADPDGIAIDTNNRIWIANVIDGSSNKETVSIFNDSGSAYADPNDTGNACINVVGNIAFDPSGNAWFGQIGGYSVCKVNSTFTTFTLIANNALFNPTGLASDGSGNIWVTNSLGGTNQVNKFNSSGTNVNGSPFKGSQIGQTYSVAIDNAGNAWVSSLNNMVEITSTGSVGSAISGNGIVEPDGVAIDGANNVWETDYGTYNSSTNLANGNGDVVELTGGSVVSGTTGYQAGTGLSGQSIAVDGSGNLWLDNLYANSVREIIGAAVPVVTPLSLAVKNNTIAARP